MSSNKLIRVIINLLYLITKCKSIELPNFGMMK